MSVISIDAGTTMIKVVGYGTEGHEDVVVRRPTEVLHPVAGRSEQDMDAVWDAVASAVTEVARQLDGEVEAVAVTAQGDGVWLVDRSGRPTGTAVLWNDGRAASTISAWERGGQLDAAFALNANLGSSGIAHAILTWFAEHDPARLEASDLSLTCGGWVHACLTGLRVVDTSDASAPFLDLGSLTYSDELLRLFDLEWARRLLPPVVRDDDRSAPLAPDVADRLGLPAGVPVVLAPYDIVATALGSGAVETGRGCCILGTTLCTEVLVDEVPTSERPTGITVASGLPGRWVRAFPTFAGGEVIRWACSLLGLDDPADLGALALEAPVGADGLVLLPYLSSAGERVPFQDADARGVLHGISFAHGPAHVARAVVEGLSLVVRDCLETCSTPVTDLRVCGGGAVNDVWTQTIADVTGVRVTRTEDTEVGARGAYLVAARALGVTAPDVVLGRSFDPDPEAHAVYDGLYADLVGLREQAAPSWALLGERRRHDEQVRA
ncbi:FGGY family carbohydrate kinase [Solicola sp. PLA-1-18]|uniref:FGGY family carbohydrate kinase n=1 Tax=Solicola sp. PLA-1-18 TaxID=3380532 RepID=UPI003B80F887